MVSFLNHIASVLSERGLRCGAVYYPLCYIHSCPSIIPLCLKLQCYNIALTFLIKVYDQLQNNKYLMFALSVEVNEVFVIFSPITHMQNIL